jgi:hypothetical protein
LDADHQATGTPPMTDESLNLFAFLGCAAIAAVVFFQDSDIRALEATVAKQQSQINRLQEGYNLVSDELWPHFAPKQRKRP